MGVVIECSWKTWGVEIGSRWVTGMQQPLANGHKCPFGCGDYGM
jgi:hypothetical protein